MPDAAAIIGRDGRIAGANEQFLTLVVADRSRTLRSLQGRIAAEVITEALREPVQQALDATWNAPGSNDEWQTVPNPGRPPEFEVAVRLLPYPETGGGARLAVLSAGDPVASSRSPV